VDIRYVFLQIWDPIGIKDEPNAQDEYDGYPGNLYELLVGGAPDTRIAEYLYWRLRNAWNCPPKIEDMADRVAALRRIRAPLK